MQSSIVGSLLDDRPSVPRTPRSRQGAPGGCGAHGWVNQAQAKVGVAQSRLSWLIASSVVIGALQRAVYDDGRPRFLLKGGTYLEVRLGLVARATKDVDTLFRGEFDDLLETLDNCLAEPWGVLALSRTEVEEISGAQRVVRPLRFKVKLSMNGQVWRSIPVEVAADEGGAGDSPDMLTAAPLGHFGLPSAPELAGIALDYQIAQKIHACSDPHAPPDHVNDRARDIVDLSLLRAAFYAGDDDLSMLRTACVSLFRARAADAVQLDREARAWPPVVVAHEHWESDFTAAAAEAEISIGLSDATAALNEWIELIDNASRTNEASR